MDPPYKKGFEEEVLSIIDRSSICTEDTVVIVESSLDTEIPDFEKLKVIRVKEYKTNKHTFFDENSGGLEDEYCSLSGKF